MLIVSHRLVTHVLKPAPGTEEWVAPLPITRSKDALTGTPTVTSYWQPTVDELQVLMRGGVVTLTAFGSTHPPVAVGVTKHDIENPFI